MANSKPGRPRKNPQTENTGGKPAPANTTTAVTQPITPEVEVKTTRVPPSCTPTAYTFQGQPVFQNTEGQYIIATGQYVRPGNVDQKRKNR